MSQYAEDENGKERIVLKQRTEAVSKSENQREAYNFLKNSVVAHKLSSRESESPPFSIFWAMTGKIFCLLATSRYLIRFVTIWYPFVSFCLCLLFYFIYFFVS